ncbi:MAG: hypothetical protein JSS02_14310 [Planctomycetes bacterium]|nr:hypothetical protein [Planctomycetota bacterium]
MKTITYRICRYIPNLHLPGNSLPFALVAATDDRIALLGIDLKGCGFEDPTKFGDAFLNSTFDILWHRIVELIQSYPAESGNALIEKLTNEAPNNLQFSEQHLDEPNQEFTLAAVRLYEQFIAPEITRCNCVPTTHSSTTRQWRQRVPMRLRDADIQELVA